MAWGRATFGDDGRTVVDERSVIAWGRGVTRDRLVLARSLPFKCRRTRRPWV